MIDELEGYDIHVKRVFEEMIEFYLKNHIMSNVDSGCNSLFNSAYRTQSIESRHLFFLEVKEILLSIDTLKEYANKIRVDDEKYHFNKSIDELIHHVAIGLSIKLKGGKHGIFA